MTDFNTCDKCNADMNTNDLIWITAEGFITKKGEELPESAYKKYDALCEECYGKIINGRG